MVQEGVSRLTSIRLLGGLGLEPGGFTQPKPLLLLAYLALEGPQPRRHLAELFWPAGDRMKSLRMALMRLRQAAPDVVLADAQRAWTGASSDAVSLLAALDRGDWSGAATLYTGPFVDGLGLGDWGAELEEWVFGTREYLAERVQHALLRLAESAARDRDFVGAAAMAERAYRLPGSAAAEPSVLERLYTLLSAGRSRDAPSVRRELAGYGLSLQMATGDARAVLASAAAAAPNNLASRASVFVGREVEIAQACALLDRSDVRLLTVVGPGGAGKSRLAVQLASTRLAAGAHPAGVFLVDLEPLRRPDQIPTEVAKALGVAAPQGQAWEDLAEAIADRQLLLVLDTFEHLLDAAARIPLLLRDCPHLQVIVTSRLRLSLADENLFPLGGLALAPVDAQAAEARQSEAVRLFAERARQIEPRFDLAAELRHVTSLCRRLGGLPLALELAAGWVRLMPCSDIDAEVANNLDLLATAAQDVPARHRSMRAVFEGSWQRLSERERNVMCDLAVFHGGFRRDAATPVAGANIPLLAALVDRSFLTVSPVGRYDRHALLHQFTLEKLARHPERRAARRLAHARYYLELAEQVAAQLRGPNQVQAFALAAEEDANLRIALQTLEDANDTAAALRLATALGYVWEVRGPFSEGHAVLQRLAASADATQHLRHRARLTAGRLAWRAGDAAAARDAYHDVLHSADDAVHLAEAHLGLGKVAQHRDGDYASADRHFIKALELAGGRDANLVAECRRVSGALAVELGNYRAARAQFEASADLLEGLGDRFGRAKTLLDLATVLVNLGEFERAHELNLECIELFRAVGDRRGEGIVSLNLALDAANAGRFDEAIELDRANLALFRELGDSTLVSHVLNNLASELQQQGEAQRALPLLEESLALQHRLGNASLLSHALFLLALVHHDLGDEQEAERCYACCVAMCQANGETWSLMRALEMRAGWHLEVGEHAEAGAVLDQAFRYASAAGDERTLAKIQAARARL